jgi:peptidyl-prolyl cis-trans isomerase C
MTSRGLLQLVAPALALVALVACGPGGEKPEAGSESAPKAAADVVATYKGGSVTVAQVTKQLEQMAPPARTYLNTPERKRSFVENMIMNDLMFDEGKKLGYADDPDIGRQVENLMKRLVVQKVMSKYQAPPPIADDDLRRYYDDNPNYYSTTQIRASHILLKDEETAKQVLAEVNAHPEKFADLAREKSTDTVTAQKGGDLGTFAQGRMTPDFERAAFALQVGEISAVVKTQYGYHIITVTERKEGERRPFDQVKEQIRSTLRNKLLQDQVREHFDALKQNAGVKIDDAALEKLNPTADVPAQMPGHPPLPGGH